MWHTLVETGGAPSSGLGSGYVAPVSRKTAFEPLRGLVSGVTNTWDWAAVRSYAYDNDALGRRVARTDTAGQVVTANAFGYNQRSEVTNAAMGGTTYSYAYDPIGNRQWAAVAVGNGQPDVAAYAANALNQYSAVTNSATSASPRETLPVYDDDGNMTAYGPWTYTWDAENRMSSACSNNVLIVTNVYDHMSRRIGKQVYVWDSQASAYSLQSSASFLWDGWNVVREVVSGGGSAFTNYYTWGLDLSGTLQGAGGVGGLLAVTRVGPESQQPQVFYPCYDANGNVTAYLDATGTVVGAFEYDAFGNTVAANVSDGLHLPFRFSTKYLDAETGLVMYQLRAYSPELGRWVSRDPVDEEGFYLSLKLGQRDRLSSVLLYAFNKNQHSQIDFLGLRQLSDKEACDSVLKQYGSEGITICYRGRSMPCVTACDGRDAKYPMMRSCTLYHEQHHVRRFQGRCDPKRCEPYAPSYRPGGGERKFSECEAYLAEMRCLKRAMKKQTGIDFDPNLDTSNPGVQDDVFAYSTRINNTLRGIRANCVITDMAFFP